MNSILFEIDQAVARITLNRPEVLNSFNTQMAQALQEALKKAEEDSQVRSLLLTGAGRAFCAGQDLAEASPLSDNPPRELGDIVERSYNPVVRRLNNIEKPVICAVNGVAAGAGANLALACDLVLASQKATFVQSFCRIGLIPDTGGSYFLPRLVGLQRAKALALLGEPLSADDAVALGLIYKSCPPESLMDESFQLARKMASQPTKGLGLIKRALNRSLSNDLESQLQLERELQSAAGKTRDYVEGVKAFLEKRPPKFKGE